MLEESNPKKAPRNSLGLRERLIRNCGATALSPLAAAAIQLGTVPPLLYAWGAQKYGEWLLLSAIPAYLTWSNLGMSDSSGNDMIMRVASGDHKGAIETFQSCWALVTACSLFVLFAALTGVWWCPWSCWLHLSSLSNIGAAQVVLVLSTYVTVGQQNGIVESGFRCDGNFVLGTSCGTLLRLLEAFAGTVAAVAGGSLLAVAMTYLVARVVGTIFYAWLLRYKSPWLTFGLRHARRDRIQVLAAPALGFLTLALGQAVSQQGALLVVGWSLGSIAVTAFSTLRTLSRLALQAVMVVGFAFWPELSRSFGARDLALARRLHRQAFQAAAGLSLVCGFLLWLAGPSIYGAWLHSSVSFDAPCFHGLLFVTAANSLWYISSIVPASANAHQRLALCNLVTSATCLGLAASIVRLTGIKGAAMALLVQDATMCWFVLTWALRQVKDTPRTFFAGLCDFSSYTSLPRQLVDGRRVTY